MPLTQWLNEGVISGLFTATAPAGLAINMGLAPHMTTLDKYGENPEVSSKEDIWEQGGEYTWSATSDISTISSSSVSDVGQLIRIQGICSPSSVGECYGYALTNGQNKVLIYDNEDFTGDPITFWRVYRMENESAEGGDLVGTLYCYVDTAIVSGVPTDTTKIRATITNGNNQTLMALYTIPPGKVGFLFKGELGTSKSGGVAAGVVCGYYSRRYGKLFKLKKRINLTTSGSSNYLDSRTFPDIIPPLTDIKMTVEEVSATAGVFGTFDILLVDLNTLPKFLKEALEEALNV